MSTTNPLVGDPVYGGRSRADIPPFHRQALHAVRLGLDHPISGEPLAWEAPPPEDFAALLRGLGSSDAA